jgi:ABC-type uncharacterized transport system involved in gliding motility auxiliary subunit
MSRIGKLLYLLSGLSLISIAVIWVILRAWVPWMGVALGLAAAFVAGSFFMDRAFYKEFFALKTTKNGMSMGTVIALVLVILAGINFLSVRHYKTIDLSAAKINSLSDQSVKVVESLKDDLRVLYFYKKNSEGIDEKKRAFSELLRKYQDKSQKLKLEFVDLNSQPALVNEFGITGGVESVYLEYQKRRGKIEKIDEQELTSGIVKVMKETSKTPYFLLGHGEIPLEASQDGASLTALKSLMEGNRYALKTFSFNEGTQIPQDADILFVLGPKLAFLDHEVKALEDYLKRGGSMVLALDPGAKSNLDGLLTKVGLAVKNNYIATSIETPMGTAIEPRAVKGSEYGNHAITKPFGRNQFTVFRLPMSLERRDVPSGITIEDVVRTDRNSMAFNDVSFSKAGDKGPFLVMAAVSGKFPGSDASAKEFNLVLSGSSTIFSDQLLYQALNRDLVLNTLNFLAKEENLISITPKEVEVTKLELDNSKFALFLFGFIIPLPVLLFLGSGGLWYRRRYS